MTKRPSDERPQADKFVDLARELECDDDEAAFDERLKKLATSKPKVEGTWAVQMAKVGNGYNAWFTPDGYGPKVEVGHFDTEAQALAWIAAQ